MDIKTVVGGNLQTNCYILKAEGDNHCVLVDFIPEVEQELTSQNLVVDKILLTHIHFDHFELLFDFQQKNNFELYLSELGYKHINNKEYNLLNKIPKEISDKIKPVDLTNSHVLREGDTIDYNKYTIKVISTPGHSEDSISYIITNIKAAFVGDTVFYGSIGRTDLPTSSESDIFKSINKLFITIDDDFTLYPGHGSSTNVEFEKKHNYFLRKNSYDVE